MFSLHVHVVHIYNPADSLYNYSVHSSRAGAIRAAIMEVCEELTSMPDVQSEYAREMRKSLYEELAVSKTHLNCRGWKVHIDEMPIVD